MKGFTWELRFATFGIFLATIALIYKLYGITGLVYISVGLLFISYNQKYETCKEWLILFLGTICLATGACFITYNFFK